MAEVLATERIYTELGNIREEIFALRGQVAQLAEQRHEEQRTEHPHVVRHQEMHRNEPTLRGSSVTVRAVVERTRLGESPEQIAEAFPVLSLAQIYDALGYYYDHTAEIEAYIQANQEAAWRRSRKASL
jgi:uncharacterized protein (DUF433 family)